MRGWLWMLRKFGPRRTFRYWRAWRTKLMIDYAEAFTPDELAILAEHAEEVPWRQSVN